MAFCFRLRCTLPTLATMTADDEISLVLASPDPANGADVRLAPWHRAEGRARGLTITGRPFETGHDATEAGLRWRCWAEVGLARLQIGADFGSHEVDGPWTREQMAEIGDVNPSWLHRDGGKWPHLSLDQELAAWWPLGYPQKM
jgi:hypothetical protein